MNRIYVIVVDSNLDNRLKEFQQQLNEEEEIISQQTVETPEGVSKLIITTREDKKEKRNLLFDQIDKGKMPNVFGEKK